MSPRAHLVTAHPSTFGWLRVSDRDEVLADGQYWEAWETPRARTVLIPRPRPGERIERVLAVRYRGAPDWRILKPEFTRQQP